MNVVKGVSTFYMSIVLISSFEDGIKQGKKGGRREELLNEENLYIQARMLSLETPKNCQSCF